MSIKLLNQSDLQEVLRCSRHTLYTLRKRPDFPMPVTGRLLWKEQDIERFIDRSKAA